MKRLLFGLAAILTISIVSANQAALDEFTTGNHLFSARLYKEILKKNQNKNFVFSPLSIEIILALTQAGASGQTAAEFTSALNLPSTLEKTQQAIQTLLPQLQTKQNDLTLQSANKLYIAEGFEILSDYKNLATSVFQSDIENINFIEGLKAAATINRWVEDHTNNKIKDLIDPKVLTSATRLVLVNALYFSGKWRTAFESYLTRKEKFYISNTETKDVDMMHVQGHFRYYECSKCNAKFLELPYIGENITMTIILPNEKEGLTALENNIEEVLKTQPLSYENVDVSLPRWLVESDFDLNEILQALGLNTAFTDAATFDKISKESLFIDQVIQKAFINVTESGTEAAAATAVVEADTLSIDAEFHPNKHFLANHPFLYVIKGYNNYIMFVGRIK